MEGEREEAGAAQLIVTKIGGTVKDGGGGGGGGGGDEKVGMALLGWDSLLQGGIQSRLTPTHHFDFEDAASNADRVSHASPSLQLSTDTAGKGPHVVFPASLQEPLAA